MDIATILGLIASFGLIGYGMSGGGLATFIDVPSLVMVFGGTIGVTFINYPLGTVLGAGGLMKHAFISHPPDSAATTKKIVEFSSIVRREGILALQEPLKSLEDPFLKKGIQLAVDGQEPDGIRDILGLEISNLEERHKLGAELFASMAATSPAMGLLGTLIGLVTMLKSLDDPSSIGPAMALALLTTFYGAIFANVLFLPVSGKLKFRSKEESSAMAIAVEGVLAITNGDNPRVVEQKLHAYLPPAKRVSSLE
ncbi:MAG: MotA/TolQ/ExbB proton channel family protein [Myxococcales bacterium]|nr:MotA/TolQ/ExbB proton channel family protein [Myxococcales bacterium]